MKEVTKFLNKTAKDYPQLSQLCKDTKAVLKELKNTSDIQFTVQIRHNDLQEFIVSFRFGNFPYLNLMIKEGKQVCWEALSFDADEDPEAFGVEEWTSFDSQKDVINKFLEKM